MSAETNANINLQIAPGVQGDHREGMDAYFNSMESLYPDYRTNAKNIYGMPGAHYSLTPTKDEGVDKCTTTPARPRRRGRIHTGFRPEAGVCARSGTTIW